MPDNESVDVKLPTGETVTAVVPTGWSDAQIHANLMMKHPEFFQSKTEQTLGLISPAGRVPSAGVPMSTPISAMIGEGEETAAQYQGKAVAPSANVLPAAGMIGGGILGSIEPGGGNIVGAGLGAMAGSSLQQILQGRYNPKEIGGQGLSGVSAEAGGQIIGKTFDMASEAMGSLWNKASGATKDIKAALEAKTSAIAEREAAHNANIANYNKAAQKIEETNTAKQAKYTQDLQEAVMKQQGARRQDIEEYRAAQAKIDVAKERVLPPAPGDQQSWRELNDAIGATPKSIKAKEGVSSLEHITSNPGRGLAAEGMDAKTLASMNPVQQSALIAPKLEAAGKAVNAVADVATKKGITLDLEDQLFENFGKAEEPLNTKLFDSTMEAAKKSGITDFKNVTPSQALQFRQEISKASDFKFSSQDATVNFSRLNARINRDVSGALKEAVPEMKIADQHYTDLKRASEAVSDRVKQYAIDPQMAGTKPLPSDLTMAKITNIPQPKAPTPITMKASPYKPLPSVPEVNREAIMSAKSKALRNTLLKAALAGGAAGVSEELVRRSIR